MSEHDESQPLEPREDGAPPSYEVLSNGGVVSASELVLPSGEAARPTRRRRLVAMGAAAVVVAGIAGGAVALAAALGGGGAQPETVVPANAVFYAEVDLDPSAGQKVDAFRFLRKFPALKDAFTADGGYGPDFAKLFKDTDIDYAKDVQPWLGKRFAVALLPGESSEKPGRIMFVLQSTDDAKAKASLTQVLDASNDDHVSLAVSGGYVVLATTLDFTLQENPGESADDALAQQLVDQAASSSLADAAAYRDAVKPFGDSVATVWADNKGLSEATKAMSSGLGLQTGALGPASLGVGTSVAVLRFDGDTLELVGTTTDSTNTLPSGGVPAVSALPDSTLAAFGGNDLGDMLKTAYGPVWDQLGALGLGAVGGVGGASSATDGLDEYCKQFPKDCKQLKKQLKESGQQQMGPDPFADVPKPDEWPTLLGDQTVLAVGGGSAEPSVGVHVVGGDDTVDAVLDLVQKTMLGSVAVGRSDDGVVVASSQSWLDAMTAGGSFGESPTFKDAVPDAAGAGMVGYVDIQGLVDQYGSDLSADDRANMEPLRALGFTIGSDGTTNTFRLRLLTD